MGLELSALGMLAAFTGGAISFLSPCVLPLVPGYLSYVAGHSVGDVVAGSPRSRLITLRYGTWFVLGFSTIFVLLGAGANALSGFLLAYRQAANIVGALLVITFGLFTTGLLRLPILLRDLRWHASLAGGSAVSAYLLGVAFAFGWTPCIGPVLASILMVSATSASADGIALLALYSFGLGVPFLLAAVFTEGLLLRMRAMRRTGQLLQVAAGLGMVAIGVAMMTGRLTDLAIWFLYTFPWLGRIG